VLRHQAILLYRVLWHTGVEVPSARGKVDAAQQQAQLWQKAREYMLTCPHGFDSDLPAPGNRLAGAANVGASVGVPDADGYRAPCGARLGSSRAKLKAGEAVVEYRLLFLSAELTPLGALAMGRDDLSGTYAGGGGCIVKAVELDSWGDAVAALERDCGYMCAEAFQVARWERAHGDALLLDPRGLVNAVYDKATDTFSAPRELGRAPKVYSPAVRRDDV
jgi:hypothetical protein